jgi:hypothetical protein
MAGSRRKEAARARLSARCGPAGDVELVNRTLKAVSEAVERRDPPSGDQANLEVSAEVRQMRAEKRAKAFIAAHARG